MDAPIATTSSGLTLLLAFLPKNVSTISCTFGILVLPPTNITSSISLIDRLASFNAISHGFKQRVNKLSDNFSNCARLNFLTKCFGTPSTAVT